MDEYINRELLKKRFKKRLDWLKKDIHDEYSGALYDCCEVDAGLIDEIPTADVAPVVHGRWIERKRWAYGKWSKWIECSECNYADYNADMYEDMPFTFPGNYCPNCGAKMDGGDSDAAG